MLNAKESETLVRVGPQTPMGGLMRQYWVPAAMSNELVADGAPMRLVLLDERLIAFRNSAGRVGIFGHNCPHRGASLFFGRNEEDGLRCVYHGWKFDVAGNCVDMPNLPAEYDYKHKVKARAYPVCERGGLIWVYMGEQAEPPPLPLMEALIMPEEEMSISFTQRECNFMQALEGDLDTTHVSFLHLGALRPEQVKDVQGDTRFKVANRRAELEVRRTPWGTMYGARRDVEGGTYWRFGQFLFPFWTMIPTGRLGDFVFARAWVPMDDTHTMIVTLVWKKSWWPSVNGNAAASADLALKYQPNTTDWYGRFRPLANASNDYLIDREAQRTRSFTGIEGIPMQDQAITESMGPLLDHDWEHLGHSDVMIIQTRRRMIEAALALKEQHRIPPGVRDPEVCLAARGGHLLLRHDIDWLRAYADEIQAAVNPTGRLQAGSSIEATL